MITKYIVMLKYHGQSRDKDMSQMSCMQTGEFVQEKVQPMQSLQRRQRPQISSRK
jgi:hypothetical protein